MGGGDQVDVGWEIKESKGKKYEPCRRDEEEEEVLGMSCALF